MSATSITDPPSPAHRRQPRALDTPAAAARPAGPARTDQRGGNEAAERGLGCYIDRIAHGLGLGSESTAHEWAEEATAYIALEQRLAQAPERDVALIWDQHYGWAVAVETGCGEDLLVHAWYGTHNLLPEPDELVRFTTTVLTTTVPAAPVPAPAPSPPERLAARLAGYRTPGEPT